MSLRTKFVAVLCLFCLAVGVNIYATIYSSEVRLRNATGVFEAAFEAIVLTELIQRSLQDQHVQIKETLTGEIRQQTRERMDMLIGAVQLEMQRLTNLREYPDSNAAAAFENQLDSYQSAALGYLHGASLPEDFTRQYAELNKQLDQLRSELYQTQGRRAEILSASTRETYAILFIMAVSELLILMTILSLFREWMLKPIEDIRQATEQIAAGNLDYRLHQHRNDELGALAKEVNHMAESLSEAQKELKHSERMAAVGEMVSVVAHNIRNPIAGIRATAQTSLHEFEPGSNIHSQQQRIIDTVDSLEQWLRQLLHLNRPIHLNPESTAVDELIGDLRQIFQPVLQRKRVEISYQPQATGEIIEVDRQHFVQAVASILDNAIEVSPADSNVIITTGRSRGESGFFIQITDAGPGVADALRQQVFEDYFSTKPGGTGIGLPMAKKIIQAHAGRLTILDGQPGEGPGATFRIEIPQNGQKRAERHG